ncbi:hypothetical protein FisN_5Hh378 [Fistulifera solaris]|uniref:Cytochrome P450 n=1 Tax=Fistulifera solaris TaxID=1519565 RepID=A0A1Z5JSJ8_FISSO|nr:hypothetical protein FisN_5Hh378 [Fistulifera solaris]|eukprot:GAX16997.1 hypothetical protein FisN_5Hh378 [Fistulifera solaris]
MLAGIHFVSPDLLLVVRNIAFALLLVFAAQWLMKRKQYIQACNQLPGPPLKGFSPWLAHVEAYARTVGTVPGYPGIPRSVQVIDDFTKNWGEQGLFRLWFFHPYRLPFARAAVIIVDPYLVRQFLTQKELTDRIVKEKRTYKIAAPILGGSFLALPDGAKWKHQRKMVARGFNQDFLEFTNTVLLELLYEQAFPEIDRTLEKSGSTALNVLEWNTRVTSETLGKVAFSYSFGSFSPKELTTTANAPSLYETYHFILYVLSKRTRSPPFASMLRFKENREFDEKILFLDSVVDKVMRERIEEHRHAATTSNGNKRHRDLLSYMIGDEDGLSYHELRANMKMFMFAGQDTTSSALSFAFGQLAYDLDGQEKLRREIDALFDSLPDDRQPEYKDVMSLKYLDAVARETLRLYSAGVVGRTTVEDCVLKSEEGKTFVIPANVSVYIFPFVNSKWTNGVSEQLHEWIPERFMGDSKIQEDWMPFSVGPRNCVGQPLAMAEFKIILCHMLRRYTLKRSSEMEEDPIPIILMVLKPHKMTIEISRRN